jgi:4-alpha-glucanotransferase
MNAIQHLAHLYGIADAYVDYRAQPRQVSLRSQAAILAAIGIDASDEQAANAAIHQYEIMRWTRLLPPVVVVEQGQPIVVPVALPLDLKAKSLQWQIALEGGAQRTGTELLAKLQTVEEATADDRSYRRVALQLAALPLG